MARASTIKLSRTFVKGLITEATPLTFPENASIDEDNCILSRKGSRSRRLGVDYEENHLLSSYTVDISEINETAFKEYQWEAVNNKASLNFLVQQVGLTLHFYDLGYDALSAAKKSFTVDLTPFIVLGTTSPGANELSFASGYGYLFCSGEFFEPIVCEYNENSDTITAEQVYIQIRDFKGVDDDLAYDEEPTTLSSEHKYNLMNQGWISPRNTGTGASTSYYTPKGKLKTYRSPVGDPIDFHYKILTRYPGNNKQWWTGKASVDGGGYKQGEFNPTLLEKFYSGNTPAPKGHFILNAFRKDRSAVSGIANLPTEITNTRPACVGFFAGRAWFGHESAVYFSQILDSKDRAGMCFQEADPTAEDVSDLVESDGGMISIPEMAKSVALIPMGASILVFATNGVWMVTGTQNGFSATDITVMKVHSIGTESPNSVVDAGGQIFWFSKVGILGMSAKMGMFGPIEGSFEKVNITETTIQEFYNEQIPDTSRQYVKAVFDPSINTIQWLFKTSDIGGNYLYNRVLNLDLSLQAFYPWTITTDEGASPIICGAFTTPRINQVPTELDVYSDSDQVLSGTDSVIFNTFTTEVKNTFIKYAILVPVGSTYKLTYGFFKNANFADWETFDGTGVAYDSFVETGYEILEDVMRDKQATIITTVFRRTETSYVPVGDTFEVDRPSSCYFMAKWNWANSSASNKWSTKVQAYRHRRIPAFSESDLSFDTGFETVVTRHKVRGSGKALSLRFETNEIGKDFDLLGWSVAYTGDQEP